MVRVAYARTQWYPVAAAADLVARHVYHGQLLGHDLALWRADDGYVNVWENRCLHRGVRLSIGINDGRELKCQYHGWRYASRSAGCTYIPAHPADAPARTITNRTFVVAERYGLIWSCLEPTGPSPDLPELQARLGDLALRGIAVNASAHDVVARLKAYAFQPAMHPDAACVESEMTSEPASDDLTVIRRARTASAEARVVFFVQPVDTSRCVIRGVLDSDAGGAARLTLLRYHNENLSALRDAAEQAARRVPRPAPMQPVYEPVPAALAEMPPRDTTGRKAALNVEVARKWPTADGIMAFELRAIRTALPTVQPGGHIDVHLPNGAIRPYSVVNGPGEGGHLTIGVKREAASRGGSACLHDIVRAGDVLAISEPRHNFPLRRDAVHTILIAGGIGITPLLAMAQALHHSRLPYQLHYFAQGRSHLAFPERLAVLGDRVTPHLGLSVEATRARLGEVLSGYRPRMQIYVCGPGAMLDAARDVAAALGWPDGAVHFEYFKNTHAIDSGTPFEVALSRSAVTLAIPAGRSILQVMREQGIDLPSSCEQGACGTCLATVLEGEPDHQDVYLTDEERRGGTKIITCVSRARSARLVLDV